MPDNDPPMTARQRYYLEKFLARAKEEIGEEQPPDNHDTWRDLNRDDEC
jgi:hypothetical protein